MRDELPRHRQRPRTRRSGRRGSDLIRCSHLEDVGFLGGQVLFQLSDEFVERFLNAVLERIDARSEKARLTVLRALDKLDRLGEEGVIRLLGHGRTDESGDFTPGAQLPPDMIDFVLRFARAGHYSRYEALDHFDQLLGSSQEAQTGLQEFETINRSLAALGVAERDVVFDPSVVRGLDYYTGPVFEAEYTREFHDSDGTPVRIGSVGGGGRYDDLVARFLNEEVPAVGFSVGISRLVLANQLAHWTDSGLPAPSLDGPVVVLNLEKDNPSIALGLAAELRKAGIRAEAYMGSSGMRPQMKYADRRNAPVAVMVGSDELEKGTVTIKDLEMGALKAKAIQSNEEYREARPGQIEVPRAEMIEAVRKIVEAQA